MISFAAWIESTVKVPVARILDKCGFTPNKLTLLGACFVVVSAFVLATTRNAGLAGVIFLFGTLCDLFDGALARLQHTDSSLGAWLDDSCDRLAEFAMLIAFGGFYFTIELGSHISLIALAVGLAVPMVKAIAAAKGINVEWDEKVIFGYPGRVAILVIGMLTTFILPAQTTMIFTMALLLTFNGLVLLYRVIKIIDAHGMNKFIKEQMEAFDSRERGDDRIVVG